jgi:wyosine [tRNA(Phe)-imidazoG37] synthetase (radical SAM superfamily)
MKIEFGFLSWKLYIHNNMKAVNYVKEKLYKIYRNSLLLKKIHRAFTALRILLYGEQEHVKSYSIELSSICNAKCVFCSYPAISLSGRDLGNMTENIFRHAYKFIKDSPTKSVSFTPITGEFFVNSKWHVYLQSILNLAEVKYVGIITNGILLTPQNIDRLLKLKNLSKIGLSISVGGITKEEYKESYGVDKFNRVLRNINSLLFSLNNMEANIPVRVEFRLLKGAEFDKRKVRQIFNYCNYQNFDYGVVDKFDPLNGLPQGHSRLIYSPPRLKKLKACRTFSAIMFSANGEIRACGCVMSDVPGDKTMRLGTAGDGLASVKSVLAAKIELWEKDQILPFPCTTCTDYVPRP